MPERGLSTVYARDLRGVLVPLPSPRSEMYPSQQQERSEADGYIPDHGTGRRTSTPRQLGRNV